MHVVEYTRWRKSRRSESSSACVEVGTVPGRHLVGVRDSKQHGCGPMLEFSTPAWEAFVAAIREGSPARS